MNLELRAQLKFRLGGKCADWEAEQYVSTC